MTFCFKSFKIPIDYEAITITICSEYTAQDIKTGRKTELLQSPRSRLLQSFHKSFELLTDPFKFIYLSTYIRKVPNRQVSIYTSFRC